MTRLRELLVTREAVSPGTWVVRYAPSSTGYNHRIDDGDGESVGRLAANTDAELIVAAVNALPGLLDALERVERVASDLERPGDIRWGTDQVLDEGIACGHSEAARRIREALAGTDGGEVQS